jgi:hypothetical protein
MQRRFSLPDFCQQDVSIRTRWEHGGLCADLSGPCDDSILKRELVLETTPLTHGARSFPSEEGGSAIGVLITDKCHLPGGDAS